MICNICQQEKDPSSFRKSGSYTFKSCNACLAVKRKQYLKDHPEKAKQGYSESKKKWLKNNRDKRKQYEQEYYLKNKEKFSANSKLPSRKKSKYQYKKNKLKDPIHRLRNNISNAICKAIKQSKNGSIMRFLNYTIEQLKTHLENQFDQNMSWNNYGLYWHLDHIIPQSDLPYSSMQDHNFTICWGLSNLRPLEAIQNLKDGATRVRHMPKSRDNEILL
jgi:hypothetical protein